MEVPPLGFRHTPISSSRSALRSGHSEWCTPSVEVPSLAFRHTPILSSRGKCARHRPSPTSGSRQHFEPWIQVTFAQSGPGHDMFHRRPGSVRTTGLRTYCQIPDISRVHSDVHMSEFRTPTFPHSESRSAREFPTSTSQMRKFAEISRSAFQGSYPRLPHPPRGTPAYPVTGPRTSGARHPGHVHIHPTHGDIRTSAHPSDPYAHHHHPPTHDTHGVQPS